MPLSASIRSTAGRWPSPFWSPRHPVPSFAGPDAELRKIAKDLTTSQTDQTCQLAGKEHVRYILDFGHFYILNFLEARRIPRSSTSTGAGAKVELVDNQGAAELFRVTAC